MYCTCPYKAIQRERRSLGLTETMQPVGIMVEERTWNTSEHVFTNHRSMFTWTQAYAPDNVQYVRIKYGRWGGLKSIRHVYFSFECQTWRYKLSKDAEMRNECSRTNLWWKRLNLPKGNFILARKNSKPWDVFWHLDGLKSVPHALGDSCICIQKAEWKLYI